MSFKAIQKYLQNCLEFTFLFRNGFIPLLLLNIYFWVFSLLLPEGVNRTFAGEVRLPLTFLTVIMGGAVLMFGGFNKKRFLDIFRKNQKERIQLQDLIFLLLPLTPVVQYILNNQDILSLGQSTYLLILFGGFSAVFILGMPAVLGFLGSARTLLIVGLVFSFTFLNMAALSFQFAWFEVGSLKIQLTIFATLFLTVWVLSELGSRKLLYLLVAVYFLSNTAVQAFAPKENSGNRAAQDFEGNPLWEMVGDRKPVTTPNIYVLVYDAYAHNETMKQYGIDNNKQEEYLKDLGFKLYPKIYSVGAASLDTMSRVFNASADYYGNNRRASSGDGVVQNLFKGFGYETYGLFPSTYFFQGYGINYDSWFPRNTASSGSILGGSILAGEFKFDFGFAGIPHDQFVSEKLEVFKESTGKPRFIDMHTSIPSHSQNSGICLPNETALYKERLDEANLEMRGDLETLIKNNPKAIIIVASDHGPYLTKNCTGTGPKYPNPYDISQITRLDLQDRFGTFLAIRWPSKSFDKYDDITVLQDLFPSVFAYLFGDESLLQSKVNPLTLDPERISGASVENGIIQGGIDDSEPLFVK